jgi:hypothetical protein
MSTMDQNTNTRTDLAVRLSRYRNGVKTELVAIRAALDELATDVRQVIGTKSLQNEEIKNVDISPGS